MFRTQHDWRAGREPANLAREREHGIGFERVHAGDADDVGPGAAELPFEGRAEAQVGDRDRVAARQEGRGDVLHAQGFDSEERAEAESFVTRNRTEQQDVHGRKRKCNIGHPQ